MLILTRRIGETLRIGDDVSLMVLGVQGNQVRIGADAPKEVAIHREEIYRRIQQEKQIAATPPTKEEREIEQKVSNGARFYSTEGIVEPTTQKKVPNVIVKKKRVFENV